MSRSQSGHVPRVSQGVTPRWVSRKEERGVCVGGLETEDSNRNLQGSHFGFAQRSPRTHEWRTAKKTPLSAVEDSNFGAPTYFKPFTTGRSTSEHLHSDRSSLAKGIEGEVHVKMDTSLVGVSGGYAFHGAATSFLRASAPNRRGRSVFGRSWPATSSVSRTGTAGAGRGPLLPVRRRPDAKTSSGLVR